MKDISDDKMNKAQELFAQVCNMLDARDWHYDRDDEKMSITAGIRGEDLPIKCTMRVRPEYEVVQVISILPCTMPEDKRVEGAIATCVANYGIVNGSFDYDFSDGMINYRLTTSYENSDLSDDLLENMMFITAATVDNYNDKFFMLSKGMMTLQQFMDGEK